MTPSAPFTITFTTRISADSSSSPLQQLAPGDCRAADSCMYALPAESVGGRDACSARPQRTHTGERPRGGVGSTGGRVPPAASTSASRCRKRRRGGADIEADWPQCGWSVGVGGVCLGRSSASRRSRRAPTGRAIERWCGHAGCEQASARAANCPCTVSDRRGSLDHQGVTSAA